MVFMLKTLVLFVLMVLWVSFSPANVLAENRSISPEEMHFAQTYFKLLYDYETQAIHCALVSQNINKKDELIQSFAHQKDIVDATKTDLASLAVPLDYQDTQRTLLEALNQQGCYLDSVITAVQAGESVENAVVKYHNDFVLAKTTLQKGVESFKGIVESYSLVSQLKIVSVVNISGRELEQQVQNYKLVNDSQSLQMH